MHRYSKLAVIVLIFSLVTYFAIADRGGFRRKNKIHFNISMLNTLKSSIPFNLRSGLSLKSNTVLFHQQIGNAYFNSSVISYKKGNTIYIVPYKQKILIPSYSPSSGYKLIIRPK